MSKERTPTSYLEDDWGMTPPGGTNASGAEKTPMSDRNNPYRVPMAESAEDWGIGKDGATSFGHSDDVKETKGATWSMDKDEIAAGYSKPKSDGEGGVLETRQPYGSFPQSIPQNYTGPGYDRGQGVILAPVNLPTPKGVALRAKASPRAPVIRAAKAWVRPNYRARCTACRDVVAVHLALRSHVPFIPP